MYHNVPNERCEYYLSNDTPQVCVGQVVWTPQPCEVEHFYEKIQNPEKCTIYTSPKNLFGAHFFSKSCHLTKD